MKQDERNNRIKVPLHAYLLYLLVASLLFTGVSFSKYYTVAGGWDSARVARFDVQMISNTNTSNFFTESLGSESETYEFSVTNNSEVAVRYDVEISLSQNLPVGMTLTYNSTAYVGDGTRRDFTFSNAGYFPANSVNSNTHSFTITADYTQLQYDYNPTVTVKVIAAQID